MTNMSSQAILERITPIFREVFNDNELEVTLDLATDEIDEWSSITQALLLATLEKEFKIKFKLREVIVMNDVATIVSLIESKIE